MMLAMRNAPIQMRGIRVTEAGRIDKKKIVSIDISMLNRLPDTRTEIEAIARALKADPASGKRRIVTRQTEVRYVAMPGPVTQQGSVQFRQQGNDQH